MSSHTDPQPLKLVWLDPSSEHSEEHIYVRHQLSHIHEKMKVFNAVNECEAEIRNQPADAGITLIVSGGLGKVLVPQIHALSQIKDIYVYCQIKQVHREWAKDYKKVQDVFDVFSELYQRLQPNQITPAADHVAAGNAAAAAPMGTESSTTNALPSDATRVAAVEGDGSTVGAAQTEEAATASSQSQFAGIPCTYCLDKVYHISESCFDCISRMKLQPQEIADFVSFCQNTLKGNEEVLSIIREFAVDYHANKATSHLYSHPFFCRFLDGMFSMACVEAMGTARVFIHDLYKQLVEHKSTSAVQVYRCEVMSKQQFQKLQEMLGKIIAMKCFFPTNDTRQTALSYFPDPGSTTECKRILFIIDADPQVPRSKPFAKFGSLGSFDDANGVLFFIGSLFKVTEIEPEKDGIVNVKLTLCANDEEDQTHLFFDRMKQKYIDGNGEIDIIGFGQFLREVGISMENAEICSYGEKLIRDHHEKLDPDHLDHGRCCLALGDIECFKGDQVSSVVWYEKALEARKKQPVGTNLDLIRVHNTVAFNDCDGGMPEKALDHFSAALKICKESAGDDDISLIPCYSNLSMVCQMQNRPIEALSYLSQAEMIAMKRDAANESTYATLCCNMGSIRAALGQSHLALGYYRTALEIRSKVPGSTDRSIASVYKSLGYVHSCVNDVAQSRAMYAKALEIYRQEQPDDNASIMEIEELIRNLPNEEP